MACRACGSHLLPCFQPGEQRDRRGTHQQRDEKAQETGVNWGVHRLSSASLSSTGPNRSLRAIETCSRRKPREPFTKITSSARDHCATAAAAWEASEK